MNHLRHRAAFSLLELLIVIAILAVLLALVMGGVQKTRAAAARIYCANNLRNISFALQGYEQANGAFPQGIASSTLQTNEPEPYPGLSWLGAIAADVGDPTLGSVIEQAYAQDKYPHDSPPHPGDRVMPAYCCPGDRRVLQVQYVGGFTVALTSYLGVNGTDLRARNGVFFSRSRVTAIEVINADGLSNTIFVGERPPSSDLYYGWWYAGAGQWDFDADPRDLNSGSLDVVLGAAEINIHSPGTTAGAVGCRSGPFAFGPGRLDNICDQFHFWSLHSGGGNFAFGDGSVHFLPYGAAVLLPALATRNGGEKISLAF